MYNISESPHKVENMRMCVCVCVHACVCAHACACENSGEGGSRTGLMKKLKKG